MTNNIIQFRSPEDAHFEDLSLCARSIIIEEFAADHARLLEEIQIRADELKALLKARNAFDQE
ncbi:hypothetical protein MZK49_05695 [Ensifer sesbaniae]|uniref:hypothetical protein n=1 Tax=Ensifer sesbaniae TaxID=1214071 RepID=UPI0020017FFE|nr:hypothetical protein [Ensifer sesbaniae]